MRWMRVLTVLSAVAMGIALAACGDSVPSAEEKREATERKEKALEKKEEELARAEAKECEAQLGGFLESLEELEARLEVGLNYDEYFDEIGNVQVAYNRLPINQLSGECLSKVGLPSEKAFNAYREAAVVWEECFEDLSCETSSVDPEIQREWAKAEQAGSQAQRGLVSIRTP
jgi:hypothetical protein